MSGAKTVVIGLTGKLDSTVAAYLLKKQGHQVVGIGIHYCPHDLPEAALAGPHHIPSLDELKKLADSLDIPFYGVNAEAQFRASIVDPFVEARLFGTHFCLETALGKLLFEVLEEKRQVLGAQHLATGHYAKLSRARLIGQQFLMLANDTKNDQSFSLSRIPRNFFEHALFPLSDLRKTEVQKIGKLVNLPLRTGAEDPTGELLFNQEKLTAIVLKNASPKLFKEGPVIKYTEDSAITEHKGVHTFFCGQKRISALERELEVVKIDAPRGVVYVDYPRNITQSHLVLNRLLLEEGFDQSRGRDVWLQASPAGGRIQARLQFLNNDFAVAELVKTMSAALYQGQVVSFANKEGAGSRIFGSACILKSGVVEGKEFSTLPRRDEAPKKTTEKTWDFIY